MVAKEHTIIMVVNKNVSSTIDRIIMKTSYCGEMTDHLANEIPYLSNNMKILMSQCKMMCRRKISEFDVIVITNTIKEIYDIYTRLDSLKVSVSQLISNSDSTLNNFFVSKLCKGKLLDILNDQLEIISECAANIYEKIQKHRRTECTIRF